jgi:hypothetical protein
MNWCCHPFRNAMENRHGDGFVAYVVAPAPPQLDPQFGFAFRAIRKEQIPDFQTAVTTISGVGNIKLSGASRVRFCPWCGVRLAEYYRVSYEELVDEKVSREFEFV